MTGVGGVLYTAGVAAGDTVAVFGVGGVGGNIIMGARIARASRIIAIDLVDRKLEWARELGATDVVDASAGDPVAAVRELTGGRGVSVAFEAVGLPITLRQSIAVLDYRGTVVMVGFPSPLATLELELQPYFFTGANLRVSLGGDGIPARDYPLLAEWYARGELDLDRLVTRRVGLDDVEAAFAAMEAGETLRSVIEHPGTVTTIA
jgi:S-(hydroxymethyl)mycothiol dehydrogenase